MTTPETDIDCHFRLASDAFYQAKAALVVGVPSTLAFFLLTLSASADDKPVALGLTAIMALTTVLGACGSAREGMLERSTAWRLRAAL